MASSSSPPTNDGNVSGINTTRSGIASATALAMDDFSPSSIPTLKVMRLQAPHLATATSSSSSSSSSGGLLLSPTNQLTSSLLLPDSFGAIHVGETFVAYLGILNTSLDLPVRGLTVSSQLQTPTRRIVLPSRLDNTPTDIPPCSVGGGSSGSGVDAIVSRQLDEAGSHILRVEVGYISNGQKSLRKFYRFNVSEPLRISESVVRSGDAMCLVSITVENVMEKLPSTVGGGGGGEAVTISSVGFRASAGLKAQQITLDDDDTTNSNNPAETSLSALQLFDQCGRLQPGECYSYLFCIQAESEEAALRGIACGDDLGRAVFTYHKSMGEIGKAHSSVVVCPPTSYLKQGEDAAGAAINPKFVVHRSGLSVDVAPATAQRSISGQRGSVGGSSSNSLDDTLPVTVEPIDPPSTMELSVPEQVPLLIVNHSNRPMNLQLQLRLSEMTGVVVCGPSYISLGELPPSGGSCTMDVRFVALVAGLFAVQGCYIVDLLSGMELQQPATV